jgi:hypothetical protein
MMRRNDGSRWRWLGLVVGLLTSPAFAGFLLPLPEIHYQGKLDFQGQPHTGTVGMRFTLWSSLSGGQMIGSPVELSVDVVEGLFSADLNFGSVMNWQEQRYLQIEINAQVIEPRHVVRAAPYAMYARELFPGSSSLAWRQFGSSVVYQDGPVGIGLGNPAHNLHVRGDNAAMMIEGQSGSSAFLRFKLGDVEPDDNRNYIALSSASASLVTRVGGADRMRILNNGRIGMGRNSPQSRLHVYRPSGFDEPGFLVELNDEVKFGVDDDATFVKDLLMADSELRVGTFVSGGSTTVCRTTGTGFAAGFLAQCSSSRRYKDQIVELDQALEKVGRMRAVSYRWIADDQVDIGLVAEELAQIDGRLVTLNEHGQVEGVKYDRLAALLVRAMQEQQALHLAEIGRLSSQLERMESDALARISALETRLLERPGPD